MGNFWTEDDSGGGGVQPGPIADSGLTLPANTLAGNATGATADIQPIPLGAGLAFNGGALEAQTVPLTALTYTTVGAFPNKPLVTRCDPQQIEFQGAITNYVGKWLNAITQQVNSALTSLSFDDLEGIISSMSFSGAALTTVNFPALKAIGIAGSSTTSIQGSAGVGISTLGLPVLEYIAGQFVLTNYPALTSFSLPAIIAIGGGFLCNTNMAALVNLSFGSGLKCLNGNFSTTSNSLNATSVDGIYNTLATLDGTNGTVLYTGRTITTTGGSAAPTAASLTARNALIARGNSITSN